MLIRPASDIRSSEITSEALYRNRREFLRTAAAAAVGTAATSLLPALAGDVAAQSPLSGLAKSSFSTTEPQTPFEDVTGYNNFYEFGTDKEDPARYAGRMKTRPWTVTVDGLVAKPAQYAIDDLVRLSQLEERVYRLRCPGISEGRSSVVNATYLALPSGSTRLMTSASG
jgi:sulfoxide reductase catalytic subunit YedY